MINRIILILAIMGCVFKGHSQVPGTWTINPAAFNYSMTLTAYIDNDCLELNDPSNAVAAFVGTQCRGFAYTDVDANGRKLAFVTIYSNQASGEAVQIRFYKSSTGQEITSLDGTTFLSNATIGNISNPFVVTTNHRPTGIAVSNLVVQENTTVGGFIGTISGMDIDAFQTLSFSLPTNSLENSSFQITNSDLELNTVLNFAIQNSYQIAIEVNDGQGCNYIDTFQVVVDDSAFPPIAENDTVSVNEDDTLQIFVLNNDSDYDNDIDTLSVQVFMGPNHGTVTIANGVVTYIPTANYFGPDTLTYSVCDLTNTGALCDTAVVFIYVISVPDAPIANLDTISTLEETSVTIPVLANDTDVENDIDPTTVQVISNPSFGTVSVLGGAIVYTPNTSYAGMDTLVYSVCDLSIPAPLCDTAYVIITVIGVPDAPTDIIIDTLTVLEDNEPNFLISHIYTVDTDLPNDNFIYELVAGVNDSDNAQFTIVGNELFINTKTIYEIKDIYHIRVRTTDNFGLSFEKEFDIKVIDIPGNTIPLPAATYISTLQDGKNDYFTIENVVIYDAFALSIFDQFGKIVFQVNDHYTNEFDGRLNGEPLPSGAYYYVFKRSDVQYKGNITIVN